MCFLRTSQTMQQSWLTPFWPLLEKTEAKLLEPSTLTMPEVQRIMSFFLASLAIASAASLPPHLPELFPLFNEKDLANPLNMFEKCPITLCYLMIYTSTVPASSAYGLLIWCKIWGSKIYRDYYKQYSTGHEVTKRKRSRWRGYPIDQPTGKAFTVCFFILFVNYSFLHAFLWTQMKGKASWVWGIGDSLSEQKTISDSESSESQNLISEKAKSLKVVTGYSNLCSLWIPALHLEFFREREEE